MRLTNAIFLFLVCLCICLMDGILFLNFQVDVPLLLVNSADDPLVHDSLLTIPRTLAGNCQHVA